MVVYVVVERMYLSHNYINNLKESCHFRFGIVGSGIRSELIKSKKAYMIKQIWVYN